VFADPWFSANWHGAKAAGLVRGAYHYGRPSVCSGHEEAAFLLQTVGDVGGLQPGDFLALDLEDPDVATGADLLGYALDFLTSCERVAGFKPMLYSSAEYLAEHLLLGHAELGDYGLWLASWQGAEPPAPAPWAFIALWQHGGGVVPGIGGVVDLDWFLGTADELRRYGSGYVPPVVPPVGPEPVPVPSGARADAEFLAYAPQSGSWREAATNLRGIADDALERGRAVVKVVGDAAAAAATGWGGR
jgi:GH25 family lysozyme M1 (1,4-beta-N-acetylmuramidase)